MIEKPQPNLIDIYCDGAAMAYRDVADKIDAMIANAPPEIKFMAEGMKPMAEDCRRKAETVYDEAALFLSDKRN